MTPTVSRQLRKKPVNSDNLTAWSTEELFPLLAEMRQAQNYMARQQATIVTDGSATFFTIWSSADIAVGTVVRFEVRIIGNQSNDRATFILIAFFYNDGTLKQQGATASLYTSNPPGYTCRFQIVSNHVELQVEDVGQATNWTAIIDADVG